MSLHDMYELSENEISKVVGGQPDHESSMVFSISSCFMYIDCSYAAGMLVSGSPSLCPTNGKSPGVEYVQLDVVCYYEMGEIDSIAFLVNVCTDVAK